MVRYEDLAAVSNVWNGTPVSSHAYANDALGRRTARADFVAGEPPVEIQNGFGYNTRSEVTAVTLQNSETLELSNFSYAYDPIGNRTESAVTVGGGQPDETSYSANALNQYSSLQSTAYSLQPSYDPDGNMITNGPWAYTWDAENRMTAAVSNNLLLVSNTYDHQSRRIRKEVYTRASPSTAYSLQSTASFLYDGWNVIREVRSQSSEVSTNYYTWGLDLSGTLQGAGGVGGLLAVTSVSAEPGNAATIATYYPTYDANGNITAYLDATGGVAARREFDAFGNTVSLSGPLAGEFSYWFSTKYLDTETGLYYYGYRFYHPDLGRWVNRDPIGERGGVNLYEMVYNSLLTDVDYLGQEWAYFGPYYGNIRVNGVMVPGGIIPSFGVETSCECKNVKGAQFYRVVGSVDMSVTVYIAPKNSAAWHNKPEQFPGEPVPDKWEDWSYRQRYDGVLAHENKHAFFYKLFYDVSVSALTMASWRMWKTPDQCSEQAKNIKTKLESEFKRVRRSQEHSADNLKTWPTQPQEL